MRVAGCKTDEVCCNLALVLFTFFYSEEYIQNPMKSNSDGLTIRGFIIYMTTTEKETKQCTLKMRSMSLKVHICDY